MFNEREMRRRNLILAGIGGLKTNKQIAFELMLTVRQITNIKTRYRRLGDGAFIHGNRGRKAPNRIPDDSVKKALRVFNTVYEGEKIYDKVNYSHFRDILDNEFGLSMSKSSVRKILMAVGYRSPKTRRVKDRKPIHPMRPRKKHMGELIQADGSPFAWFGGTEQFCIQGFVDDASGVPVGLYMTKHECLFGYLEAARQMLTNYGIPQQLYPDRLGIFFVNNAKNDRDKTGEKKMTQFGRIMEDLGVDMYPAYSPEAKGRIERFWETIQSRLFTEFRIRGIKTMEAANRFLPVFMKMYKKWFGRQPQSKDSYFVPMGDAYKRLDRLLVASEDRVTDSAGVFSLMGYKFEAKGCRKEPVKILMSEAIGIEVVDKKGRKREVSLLKENRGTLHMPQVRKALIDEYFHKDAKAKYRKPAWAEAGP
jgi:transposase